MKILLTGATGYIGKRLLPVLVNQGHTVICCVRDVNRFHPPESIKEHIIIVEVDFLKSTTLQNIPQDFDIAYYLMHSMSATTNYQELEQRAAINFRKIVEKTTAEQVIYLSGIVNEKSLSKHLNSRKTVEKELEKGTYHLTTLRAGIIIGSGSASFEIIRDLVEKLPIMITPIWLRTRCQPIGIRDVINYLVATIKKTATYDKNFDIGGTDILSYKEMLLGFAKARGLKRSIFIVPVMTPKLSSYWLYFVTSTSYRLATALVSSMKIEVICRDNALTTILGITPAGYAVALERSFAKIEANQIISSWKDSLVSGRFNLNLSDFVKVPTYGCFTDKRKRKIRNFDQSVDKIWKIGGDTGWYYATSLWKLRGFIDRCVGGVGLRRGRTQPDQVAMGDAIDFWRVLYANKKEGRLLLFAEMKLPGEAWLEFKIEKGILYQTATFRPKGVLGRLYWYSVYPFHEIVFKGLINQLTT